MTNLEDMKNQIQIMIQEQKWEIPRPQPHSIELIVNEAINRKIVSSNVSVNLMTMGETLAEKLIANPTKITNIGNLERYLELGIQSGSRRGAPPRVTELATGHEDRVHFTFGIPYLFNTYSPRYCSTSPKNFIVVLKGNEIFARSDLYLPFIDSGIIYRDYNPFSHWAMEVLKQNPGYHQTDCDPTYLLYAEITKSPKVLSLFKEYMEPIYGALCLMNGDLREYLAWVLANSFSSKDQERITPRGLKRGDMPEGNLASEIPITEIRWIILHHDDYSRVTKKYTKDAEILVDAGCDLTINPELVLLKKYTNLIGADDSLCELSLFCAGKGYCAKPS